MQEHSIDKLITTLSDYEILKIAFTDFECGQNMVNVTGSESFVPDLLTAVKANKNNYDNIGLAIRQVLGEQLNPMIQLDEFQDDFKHFKETKLPEKCEKALGKLVGGPLGRRLGKMLPNIASTDDLINFTIRNSSSSTNLIQIFGSSTAKTLQTIRLTRSLFGTDLSTIKKELSELSEKSGSEGDKFVKASKNLSSIIKTLKENAGDEDKLTNIFQKKANVTISDIEEIKDLIDNNSYQKLKNNIEDRHSSESNKKDYDSEIQKKSAAMTPIEHFLEKENKEARKIMEGNTNAATYTEAVISLVNLGIRTCKNQPKESPPTNQIAKLLQNGKISPKVKARLMQAIEIINNQAKNLKEQSEAKEKAKLASIAVPIVEETIEDPTPTAEVTKFEQHQQEQNPQPETEIAATEEMPDTEEAAAVEDNQAEELPEDEAIEQGSQPADETPQQQEEPPEATTKPELEKQNEKIVKEAEPEKSELEQLQEGLKTATGLIEKLDPKEGERPTLNDGEKHILKLMSGRRDRLEKQIAAITEAKDTTSEHTAHSAVQELGKKYLAEDKLQEQDTPKTQEEHQDNREPQNIQHEIQTNGEIDSGVPEQENNINEQAADTNTQGILARIFSAIKDFVSSFFKAESSEEESSEEEPPVTTPPDFTPIGTDSLETKGLAAPEDKINPLNQNNSDDEGITDKEESEDEDGMQL